MADVLAGYRSPEERERALEDLAATARAEIHVLGSSVEGRPIRAARVPSGAKPRRSLLVCAGIHGPEYIGTAVALAVLARIRSPGLAELLDHADVWIVPALNPDGYARTWALGGEGKLHLLRSNAHHVDLNRNFPLPAPQPHVRVTFGGWRTGSADPNNPFFRGVAPASEPETAAIVKLAVEVPFAASISLHSTMGLLIPACAHAPTTTAAYRELCATFAAAQLHTRYRTNPAMRFDQFTGEQDDHQHHAHGTWAITVEHYPLWVDLKRFLQPNLFRRFNPPEPDRWIDNDVPGIAAYFRAALALPPPVREYERG